jgi:hypothetical protein
MLGKNTDTLTDSSPPSLLNGPQSPAREVESRQKKIREKVKDRIHSDCMVGSLTLHKFPPKKKKKMIKKKDIEIATPWVMLLPRDHVPKVVEKDLNHSTVAQCSRPRFGRRYLGNKNAVSKFFAAADLQLCLVPIYGQGKTDDCS